MPVPFPIVCEIEASRSSHAAVLAEIAAVCARDLGQSLAPRPIRLGRGSTGFRAPDEASLTLRLPAELAASRREIWCLACRLACFLPRARVVVVVEAAEAFHPPGAPGRSRDAA